VCDIAMPREDGYSLIRKVRAMSGPISQVPAAAFTAHAREAIAVAAVPGLGGR